jgi:hypothetical protein
MYTPHIITLINASEQTDGTMEYNSTILDGVFLDLSKQTNVSKSGLSDADSATLFIPFSIVGKDALGSSKSYIEPKAYEALQDKSGYWTLKGGGKSSAVECFFIKGKVDTVLSYADSLTAYDYVYAVTTVDLRDFGSKDMQHWQVGGK